MLLRPERDTDSGGPGYDEKHAGHSGHAGPDAS